MLTIVGYIKQVELSALVWLNCFLVRENASRDSDSNRFLCRGEAMGDIKQVVWFANDKKPNRFFFQSAFRSWKFLANTALVARA